MKKPDISLYTLILTVLIMAYFIIGEPPRNVLSWDVFGYYLYLPFTFIYHDPALTDITVVEAIIDKYQSTSTFYQALPMPEGYWVLKYPMGMALMYLPWFVIGQLWAVLGGYEEDGFSLPYQLSLLYGSFIYTILGLMFFRKAMLHFFHPKTVAILIVAIVFGTNYLVHTAIHGQGLMSHNYLFLTFALILWFTIRWHELPKTRYAVALGILIGISALSRPTEILVLAVPVLWGVKDWQSLVEKSKLVLNRWKDLLLGALIILIFGSFQLIYYKVITGKFLFNSYGGNAGEGMEFLNPYIWQVLFSYRKGWLLYTPLMALALFGFIILYRSKKHIFLSVLVFFISAFYVVASWSCWWYADCFSQRALIPMYVFLALPLGTLLNYFQNKNQSWQRSFLVLIPVLILFNLFQSWQFKEGIIHTSRMTRDYYRAVFLKTEIDPSVKKLLLIDRGLEPEQILQSGQKFTSRLLAVFNFESAGFVPDSSLLPGAHGYVIQLNPAEPLSPKFEISYAELGLDEYGILKISTRLFNPHQAEANPVSIKAAFVHNGYPYHYRAKELTSELLKPGQWNEVQMLYLTPEVRRPSNLFHTNIWLQGEHNIYIDEMKVELLIPDLEQ